jgi:RNA polymerase sigma-70 factor (ECF subfamily)
MAMAFDRYRARLERMVRVRLDPRLRARLDVEDVVQDAYLEASRRLPEYLQERKVPFYLWLRFIAGQKLIEAHRIHGAGKRDVRRERDCGGQADGASGATSAVLAHEILASQTTPSGALHREELRKELEQALETLEPVDREVIILRHHEHMTNTEAAEVLGITANAAAQRHFRALQKMRESLGHLGLSGC